MALVTISIIMHNVPGCCLVICLRMDLGRDDSCKSEAPYYRVIGRMLLRSGSTCIKTRLVDEVNRVLFMDSLYMVERFEQYQTIRVN